MAKVEITQCDRCGNAADRYLLCKKNIVVITDRKMDAAGSVDDEWQNVDLCDECAFCELQDLINTLTCEQRKEWLRKVSRNRERLHSY